MVEVWVLAIGKMQHSLALQSKGASADGAGGSSGAFSTFATTFGRIEAQGGGERFFGDQNEARTTHKITIRFRRNLTVAHRILYSFTVDGASYTRTFNIRRIENKGERDKYLEILCDEGVAT
jgi:SPP1 family predicted phage head-tail adaptor